MDGSRLGELGQVAGLKLEVGRERVEWEEESLGKEKSRQGR